MIADLTAASGEVGHAIASFYMTKKPTCGSPPCIVTDKTSDTFPDGNFFAGVGGYNTDVTGPLW